MINLINNLKNKLSKIEENFCKKIFDDYSYKGIETTDLSDELMELCTSTFEKINIILEEFKEKFQNIINYQSDKNFIIESSTKLTQLSRLFSKYK
jgi:hypothetical protein